MVIQFNKRDLNKIVAEEEIIKTWKPTRIPICFASALLGKGVVETFRRLLEITYVQLDKRHGLSNVHGLTQAEFVSLIIHPKQLSSSHH
jgi:hypothetical protein